MLTSHTHAATSVADAHAYQAHITTWFTWINAGDDATAFNVSAGTLIDPLTAVMLSVVCGIGFLITVFAAGYMKGEAGYFRFFAYLGLFLSAMTILVMGDNLIMLYLGWEGVGLCSYLLIGYYYDQPAAREAAKKAFIVNRIGDFGFAIGILLTFYCFGTVSFFGDGVGTGTGFIEKVMSGSAAVGTEHLVWWIPFCLLIGALGKSAQFPLYVWLPDAMTGPTPVSALIHAATMVTAGIYMIVRCGPLFYLNSDVIVTIAVLGAFTAVFAGTISMRQYDLKRDFAFSTVSQLGFMFVAVAVLAPVAAVFHLITHAFFKALLFLSSGVIMHATHGELDMRKMSGLKTYLPKTRWLMLIGCAALAGFPLVTAGFYSKDEILVNSFKHQPVLGAVMLLSALMTAYYTFRLYFRVFEGPTVIPQPKHDSHADAHAHTHVAHDTHAHGKNTHHNHEPWLMILPLVVLAIGSLAAGFINFPHRDVTLGTFLGQSPSVQLGYEAALRTWPGEVPAESFGIRETGTKEASNLHTIMMIVSGLVAIAGILVARYYHLTHRNALQAISLKFNSLVTVLEAKYWIDEIFQAVFVEPLRFAGRVLGAIDRFVVDGVVFIVSFVPQLTGFGLKMTTQRGYLQGYALSMLLGLAVILVWVFV